MRDLLERVKAATGPDRELDAAVTEALGRRTASGIPSCAGYLGIAPFTASLDSVLALGERVLPGAYVELSGPRKYLNIPTPVPNRWRAEVTADSGGIGWGNTAALALLAATLSALMATAEETDAKPLTHQPK